METPLEPSLDKLRDKTLSFGCYILGKSHGRNGDIETETLRFVCNEEEKDYQPRYLHVNSEEWSFMMPDEGLDYDILGHPLTYGVIQYRMRKKFWENLALSRTYTKDIDNIDSRYWELSKELDVLGEGFSKIDELFGRSRELYNQDETQWQKHEVRLELLKWLQELQKYL